MQTRRHVAETALRRRLRTPPWDYAAVTAVFFGIYGSVVAALERRDRHTTRLPNPFDFGLLVLATYRLARIVSHEQVARFLRAPFVQNAYVEEHQGITVEEVPRGEGLRQSLGQLLTCSWCTGVWASAALVYAWLLVPRLARPLVYVMAVSGAQLLLDVATELANKGNLYFQDRLNAGR